MKPILDNKWTLIFALAFALLMQPVAPLLLNWYNAASPVVSMSGVVVAKSPEAVVIHITGDKLRSCVFIRVTAMVETKYGSLLDAYLERTGGKPHDGATKPIGRHDLGLWRVWPVEGAVRAIVFVQHDCAGAAVLSRIADVDLTGGVK